MYLHIGVLNVLFCIKAESFSRNTHSYLGNLSDYYLKYNEPTIYNNIINILNDKNGRSDKDINSKYTISSVSSWADTIKRNKEYIWTKTFHYIDIMECKKEKYDSDLINSYCKDSCIISALISFVEELKYRQTNKICKLESEFKKYTILSDEDLLKFIIHFIEDFIEPMHLLGYQRGGNTQKIKVKMPNGKTRSMNLHSLWDSTIPEYYTKIYKPSFNYSIDKPNNYSSFIEQQLNTNIRIACLIYPNTNYIIFNDYFNKEFMDILFKSYHDISISTFKYIFS